MVVYKMVKKLLATKPELKKPLKECEQDYDYLVHDAHDEAVEAVSEGAPKFGEDAMSGSQTVPQSCEYWFKEYGKKSPLTRVNSAVYEIASVARAVIRLLE
ncbi:Cell wall / vacuolar inhibitor of fructosidase 1 [Linum grandiflorum]